MLRVTQQSSSAGAKRYYAGADYYSEGLEVVGAWGGVGAQRLGLTGEVDQRAFDHLCDNRDPTTGRPLTARTRTERTVGYDFTFSVPKSVSLVYARSGDGDILAAFRAAVDETMRDLERDMKARVRKGGKDADRVTGNMVWAEFVHTTSRPVDGVPDPQLHAHCFAFNATWDGDEKQWKAGQFRDLKAAAPHAQAAFRVRLANKLQDLGFGITRTRDDFELAGVPDAVLKRFSRRTTVIEDKAAELGVTDPRSKDRLGAATREKKDHTLTWADLQKRWEDRLTPDERDALTVVQNRRVRTTRPAPGKEQAVDYALAHVFARQSVATEQELITEALKRGLGSVSVEGVRNELARRPLVRGIRAGRAVATTPAVLAEEEGLIAFARSGRGKFRPLGDPDRAVNRDWLNAGQRAAVSHVLGSRDRVTLVRGAAGTGKTTLEQELREALAEAGKPCVAIAPSAGASRGVLREEAGFATADTVTRFLKDRAMQERARGGVILLDEASLLGTKDTLALFRAAEGLDARLVVLGDKRQHRSVARGQPLKLLEERAGLPVAEVTDIVRQKGSYRKIAQALSEGKTAEGLAALDRLGWVREGPDADRYRVLAEAYLSAVREKTRGGGTTSALVVTPTHAEAARITQSIRATLRAERRLGAEQTLTAWAPAHLTAAQKGDATNYEPGDLLLFHQNAPGVTSGTRMLVAEGAEPPTRYADRFELFRPAKLTVAVGDRVRVTANGKTKDGKHRLDNGTLYEVHGFTARGDLVIDHGWVIGTEGGVHLTHGYAVTSHAAQGRTVDKVFIGLSSQSLPAATQRSLYVAATRGREAAVIFTDDKAELATLARKPDTPLSAVDLTRLRHPRSPFRQRLDRHLTFLRRQLTFRQTHASQVPDRDRTTESPLREARHER